MKRVNRFLLRERYKPKGLFDEVKLCINLVGGILSGDDSTRKMWICSGSR